MRFALPRHFLLCSIRRHVHFSVAVSLLLMCACSHLPVAEKKQTLFFPPPPEAARLQYLGSISSERDLPRKQSGFADLVLGEKPETFPLVKPIAALLAGARLYVCDTVLNTVITYDLATGEGGNLKGDRGNGKIQQPNNITLDADGKFYVCDKLRGAVLVYGPDEEFIAAWGRPKEVQPVAVAIGKQHLYVCDVKDHEIEVWDRATGAYQRAFGEKGTGPGQFFFPTQIALDSQGNLWVTDTGNFRVQEFTPEGKFIKQIGKHGTALGHFAWPKGMDLDAHDQLFVVDARFANVQVFDPSGKLLLFFGAPGPDGGNLDLPAGLHVQPWPAGVPWLQERLAPGFQPEELVTVVSQKGAGFVNFFAVARQGKDIP
jgi:sugar lactone lactonase YvrE